MNDPSEREPDYRFTLANERTFLAWIRTALALVAGGVAVTQIVPDLGPDALRHGLGLGLVCLAFVVASTSYRRFHRVQQAMREGVPMPPSRVPALLAAGVSAVILGALILILV